MSCKDCDGLGWVEAQGRLGHEIQHCQTCGALKSDKEAYEKASKVMDTSKHKFDVF